MNMVGVIYNGQTYNGAETREKEKKRILFVPFCFAKTTLLGNPIA